MSFAVAPVPSQTSNASPSVDAILRQLREETMPFVLATLCIAGLVMAAEEGRFLGLQDGFYSGLLLFLWPVLVWELRGLSHLLAGWALVLGLAAVVMLIVAGEHSGAALCLLALPTGAAIVFIGMPAGVLTAAGMTALLFTAPGPFHFLQPGLRAIAVVQVWGTVGLIWLTLRPLVTAVQWSWSSHEQSQRLLEQARNHQVQYEQTLVDLANANLQLTRLNSLAEGLRQAAEEARRVKEQFIASVSHELRTPLNMIIGFSEMILRAPDAYGVQIPSALLADLTVILRNSQHLASLIDDVLDLSQIEAGQMALIKEQVPFREIVEAAAVAVRPLFDSKGLYLEINLPEDNLVYCDRTRVREVLLNLLSNAGRFTEHGGVKVQARRDGSDILVSVADTGPGISAQDKEKLFQPFQQVDGSIRRRYGGSGLGLSISKSFVELHGGKMWLESQVGIGTTVSFRLPVDSPVTTNPGMSRWFSPYWYYEERTHRSLAPVPIIRTRFVVLEQGDTLQHLLSRHLGSAEIVAATDLDAALRDLARVPARALLVNAASAGDMLQRLNTSKGLPFGTPAVICSIPGAHEAAGTLGVSDYLVKPVTSDALLATLDRLNLAGKTILIVDDEPEAVRLFWRILASSGRGYRVLTAKNGRRAESILRAQRPDAMLLDLVMPDMDGFRLLELKKQDPDLRNIPVIVVSARDPSGQPIVSDALTVTRGGGLTVPQVLACIEGLTRTLATAGQIGDPTPPATPPGSPACG